MPTSSARRYPAAWYPDPYTNGSQLRWYDGSVWTEHTYATSAPSALPVAQARAEATTITVYKRSPDHAFHFIMTICTGGAWLPVWIIAALWPRRTRVVERTVRS